MKSAKEKLERLATTPYPHKGWHSEHVVTVSAALRIMRQVAHRSFKAGQESGIIGQWSSKYRRAAVSLIIDGKKGRRK